MAANSQRLSDRTASPRGPTSRPAQSAIRTLSVPVLLVIATTVLAARAWNIETVQVGTRPGGVGFCNALAMDPTDGAPTIAYSDNDHDDVLFVRWTVTWWTRQVVDAGRDVAMGIDLAYDAMNRPASSYGWGALRLAEWNGTRWASQTVETKNARNARKDGSQRRLSYSKTARTHENVARKSDASLWVSSEHASIGEVPLSTSQKSGTGRFG